jgi:secreted trypsin-like serine protease
MRLVTFFVIAFIYEQGNCITYECNTASACGCSASSTVLSRIVGGEPATHESWSWAVSLRVSGGHICGGSIISPLLIATAAHCIEDITTLTTLTILAGSTNVVPSSSNKVYQIRSIAQIYKHANYDSDKNINDIALLRLSSPLNMTMGNLKPICLPTGTTAQPPDNINMVAVGWGVTSMSSDTVSPILRQVTVQSIGSTVSSCKSTIYNSQYQFCAGLTSGGKGNTSI